MSMYMYIELLSIVSLCIYPIKTYKVVSYLFIVILVFNYCRNTHPTPTLQVHWELVQPTECNDSQLGSGPSVPGHSEES